MTTEHLTIALIEDEPDIRAIGKLALESIGGHSVREYASGLQALDRLPHEVPDLILLDMMMPGLDGIGTFERLRSTPSCAKIPVVFMTARVQPSEVADYLALGANGVIPKPYDPMLLAQQVYEIWRAHHDQIR